MRRRLLVLAAIFGATLAAAWAMELPMTVAVIVTVVVGFSWIVANDVRRPSWAESQRAQDTAYAAGAIAVLHEPGQAGADCSAGFDGGFSGGDCGAGGM